MSQREQPSDFDPPPDSKRLNTSHTSRPKRSGRGRIRLPDWASRVAWWRAIPILLALWWLAAKVGDTALDFWWLRDALGEGSNLSSSTWGEAQMGADFAAAHARLEKWRWGASIVGALMCGGWAWRQGRIAVEHARESEASLGALWSVDEEGTPVLAGLDGHQTGRWIPLEDKLALDRFRGGALRLAVALSAIVGGMLGGRTWPLWLDFWHARDLGQREPWLGADLSFYLFRLPALDFAWRLLLVAQCMALALAVAIYLYEDALQAGRRLWASRRALKHLGALLALLLVWKAVGSLLYPFELLVSRSPEWSGPHALDWNWRVPLNFFAALLALACAGVCLHEARRERPTMLLRWALAPVAASWILVVALPFLRGAIMSPEQAAREDEPFAHAQTDWTLLALGFQSTLTSTSSPSAQASTERAMTAQQAQQALALAPGSHEMATWGQGSPISAMGSLSLEPKTRASTSTRVSGEPEMFWQQAEPHPLSRRSSGVEVDTRIGWKRFVVAPVASSQPTSTQTSTQQNRVRLLEQSHSEMEILCGLDPTSSPGLLFDTEVMAVVAASGGTIQLSGVLSKPSSRESGGPNSFFSTSFEQDARARRRGAQRLLPLFRVHNGQPASGSPSTSPRQEADEPHVGVALDTTWKRMLAAWRLGAPSLALSPRTGEGARLSWRLDVAQRCRRLAPFLSWPTAPRPVRAPGGRLVWLMDGYTLSAAFPLARPLDTARAFATVALPDVSQSSPNSQGTPSPTATPSGLTDDERRTHALQMWRREGVLSRVAVAFDGYNWARASVVALVDAQTGHARLFPLDESDPILSIYRRALPELWSPASALPRFARMALRPPPHLAALQASAWASLLAPTSEAARGKGWAVRDLFFLPSSQGIQTLVRLARSGKRGSSTSASSTWGPLNAPAAVALTSQPTSTSNTTWQARFLSEPGVEAQPLLPLEAGPSPAKWAQRSSAGEEATSSTWRLLPARSRLQKARELFRASQKAREEGDWSRFEDLSRQLETLLDQTP